MRRMIVPMALPNMRERRGPARPWSGRTQDGTDFRPRQAALAERRCTPDRPEPVILAADRALIRLDCAAGKRPATP